MSRTAISECVVRVCRSSLHSISPAAVRDHEGLVSKVLSSSAFLLQ